MLPLCRLPSSGVTLRGGVARRYLQIERKLENLVSGVAILAEGPLSFSVGQHTVQKPLPGSGDTLIRVQACGLCASDVKMYQGSDFYWGENGRVRQIPVVPGHEFVGIVEEIDSKGDVHAFTNAAVDHSSSSVPIKVGDRVVAETQVACGACWYCRNSMAHKCDHLQIFGQGLHGGLASHVTAPRGSTLHLVPDHIPSHYAAFAEPLAVGLRAVARAKFDNCSAPQNSVAVVAGCGSIGLSVVIALRSRHPEIMILAIDLSDRRLETAKACGAHVVVKPDSLKHSALELCHERGGVDMYFETTGHDLSVAQGLHILRKCGTFVHVGITSSLSVAADWNIISAQKELTIAGSSLGLGFFPSSIELLSGCHDDILGFVLPMDKIVTHTLGLSSFEAGFELISSRDACMKVVFQPSHPSGDCVDFKSSRLPSRASKHEQPIHVVLFKLKSDATPSDIVNLSDALASYQHNIPGITKLSFGEILKGAQGVGKCFTHVVIMEFESFEALNDFGPHPEHLRIKESFVDPIVEDKAVVDFLPDTIPVAVQASPLSPSITTPDVLASSSTNRTEAIASSDFLLSDGTVMPCVGFGTFFGSSSSHGEICKAVQEAIACGYRHIDTAEKYGTALEEIGNAWSTCGKSRGELFLASKLWNTNHAPENVLKSMERHLRLMKTDYLDLFLVHWPLAWEHTGCALDGFGEYFPRIEGAGVFSGEDFAVAKVPLQETWEAMEDLVQRGLVRSIGVSNMSSVMLLDLLSYARIIPSVHQFEIHPGFQQEHLVNLCLDHGIRPVAYSPLGRPGLLAPEQPNALEHPALTEIATRLCRSPAQVALRWALQRGVGVVPKTSSGKQRLLENLSIEDFSLSDEDMQVMRSVENGIRLVKLGSAFEGGGFSLK